MVTVSKISKVESTKDNPGWVIYFDKNTHFIRLSAKYNVRPKRGDKITLHGFPQTRGLELNDKVVFMYERKEISSFYGLMNSSMKRLTKFEHTLSTLKQGCKV